MRPIKKATLRKQYALNGYFGAVLFICYFFYELISKGRINYFAIGGFIFCFILSTYWYTSHKKILSKIEKDENGNPKPTRL